MQIDSFNIDDTQLENLNELRSQEKLSDREKFILDFCLAEESRNEINKSFGYYQKANDRQLRQTSYDLKDDLSLMAELKKLSYLDVKVDSADIPPILLSVCHDPVLY